MTIEEIRSYAKEKGMSSRKIDALVSELHPDESGKLNAEEALSATFAIDYHIETVKFVRSALDITKTIRDKKKSAK